MTKKFENALVYRVAKSYYMDNLSQLEIAKQENISRSTVSRLLERARTTGVVCIEIKPPSDFALKESEEKLQEALGLDEVIVVPASVGESSPQTQQQLILDVASVAAAHLPSLLEHSRFIGVGWGRTVYYTAEYLPQLSPSPEKLFVPLVSNASLRNRFLQSGESVRPLQRPLWRADLLLERFHAPARRAPAHRRGVQRRTDQGILEPARRGGHFGRRAAYRRRVLYGGTHDRYVWRYRPQPPTPGARSSRKCIFRTAGPPG